MSSQTGQEILTVGQMAGTAPVFSGALTRRASGGQRATQTVAAAGGGAPEIEIYTLDPGTRPGMPRGGSTLQSHLSGKMIKCIQVKMSHFKGAACNIYMHH